MLVKRREFPNIGWKMRENGIRVGEIRAGENGGGVGWGWDGWKRWGRYHL